MPEAQATTLAVGNPPSRAFALSRSEGEHLEWPDKGHEFWIKVSGEQTGGSFCVVEAAAGAGARVGLHVHDRDEEWYWILEGTYRFTLGDEQVVAAPGAFLFIPRGTPHGWALESDGGRVLIGFSPAGGELIFREIAAAKAAGGDTPQDWVRLGARTHTRWLG